jgi:uncharacterized MnhB-related membrane protein
MKRLIATVSVLLASWASVAGADCLHSARGVSVVSMESVIPADVPDLSITAATQGTVLITAAFSVRIHTTNVWTSPVGRVTLFRDNEPLASYSIGVYNAELPPGAGLRVPVSFTVIDAPSPGEHEYRVVWFVANPGMQMVVGSRLLQLAGACS